MSLRATPSVRPMGRPKQSENGSGDCFDQKIHRSRNDIVNGGNMS